MIASADRGAQKKMAQKRSKKDTKETPVRKRKERDPTLPVYFWFYGIMLIPVEANAQDLGE
jgi:hypothetical protein